MKSSSTQMSIRTEKESLAGITRCDQKKCARVLIRRSLFHYKIVECNTITTISAAQLQLMSEMDDNENDQIFCRLSTGFVRTKLIQSIFHKGNIHECFNTNLMYSQY